MSEPDIYLACCTFVLVNEIENLRLPQKDVALTFAMALRSEAHGRDKVDWEKVGAAALRRWKPSGWMRVKELGWAYFGGRKKPDFMRASEDVG
jgi:hypothetical protein